MKKYDSMNKYIKLLLNPQSTISTIYFKYITESRYLKIHESSFKVFLKEILSTTIDEYFEVIRDLLDSTEFYSFINDQYKNIGSPIRLPSDDKLNWANLLYFVVRKLKPETILETGCFWGTSSAHLLLGLKHNKKGTLVTIDFPAYFEKGGYKDENPFLKESKRSASLPPNKEPGFLIPDFCRNNWTLILGTSSEKLISVLGNLSNVDIFLHDSLHSYANMMFEFSSVIPKMKYNSLILSDNINWHSAFHDFATVNRKKFSTYLANYESKRMTNNFGAIII